LIAGARAGQRPHVVARVARLALGRGDRDRSIGGIIVLIVAEIERLGINAQLQATVLAKSMRPFKASSALTVERGERIVLRKTAKSSAIGSRLALAFDEGSQIEVLRDVVIRNPDPLSFRSVD